MSRLDLWSETEPRLLPYAFSAMIGDGINILRKATYCKQLGIPGSFSCIAILAFHQRMGIVRVLTLLTDGRPAVIRRDMHNYTRKRPVSLLYHPDIILLTLIFKWAAIARAQSRCPVRIVITLMTVIKVCSPVSRGNTHMSWARLMRFEH